MKKARTETTIASAGKTILENQFGCLLLLKEIA
jgi:hypothetical protein